MPRQRRTEDQIASSFRDLERRRLRALVDRDVALARELHASDYQLVPPSGRAISGADYLGAIEHGELVYDVFEPVSEIAVRAYRDAAVVRYQVRITAHGDGWRDEGIFWHTDLYEFRNGRWQAAWSQATRIKAEPGV